jgi:DnaJ-class molecular chaperone
MERERDLYKILGVDENADTKTIKDAYRKLAKKYHPDKTANDTAAAERFKEVSAAYEVLKDPEKRKKYDAMRKNPFGAYGNGNGSFDFQSAFGDMGDLNDILASIFGGGSFTGRRKTANNIRFDFGGFDGGGAGGFHTHQVKRDTHQILRLPLGMLIRGGAIEIRTPAGKKVKIDIPAGTPDGNKIRLRDQAVNGDLILEIVATPDKQFYFEGNNLIQREEINFFEALFGKKITIKAPSGKTVKLKIPAGSNSGKRFRLPGLGFNRKGTASDLYIEIAVTIPDNLTKEQMSLLKQAYKLQK